MLLKSREGEAQARAEPGTWREELPWHGRLGSGFTSSALSTGFPTVGTVPPERTVVATLGCQLGYFWYNPELEGTPAVQILKLEDADF